MATVTVSAGYEVVIPPEVRQALDIRPGQRMEALVYEGRLMFIPVRKLSKMRGFLRGMNTSVPRGRA